MANVAVMGFEDRLGEVLRRSLPFLGSEFRAQVAELVSPASLAVMAGVLVGWVASHAFGVGELVDIILGAVGFFSLGLAVFSGLDELWEFASGTYRAGSDADLDAAARHFAKAVSILGIQAVLAVLFKGRPQTNRGKPLGIGPEPPRGPGLRARPTTVGDPTLPAGSGETDAWGNITYSLKGTAQDQALVLAHERIHQMLTPKLYLLRRFRVENRTTSYFRSSLSRYLEEALAEYAGQTQIQGRLGSLIEGIKFPVENGYVYLRAGGGFSSAMAGKGVLTEVGGLVGVGAAAGWQFTIWFRPVPGAGSQAAPQQRPAATPWPAKPAMRSW